MSTSIKDTARKLDIQHVYISASNSSFHNDFDPLMPNQMLTGQYTINTVRIDLKTLTDEESNVTHRFLRCYVQAGMRYFLGEQPTDEEMQNEAWIKSKLASEISAIYCVEYSIRPDVELTSEENAEFGRVNVPYHVWPYWREYCQNTCNRMNLPVSVVPMLIIDPIPKMQSTPASPT